MALQAPVLKRFAAIAMLASILVCPTLRADTTPNAFFERHAEGWFWYHDPAVEQPPATDSTPAPPADATDPVQLIAQQRKALEEAMDRAVIDPTPENMRTYLALNQQTLNQARAFSEAWRGAVWTTPSLDYTLSHPVGSAAYVKADETTANTDSRLRELGQDWGLVFFFRGTCPYCHKFAPVLKQFAATYGFRVIAVSLDGGNLPEYPNPQPNAGAGAALHVEAVPAVYLINPHTRAVVPSTFGLVGWSELSQRILYAVDHAGDQTNQDNTPSQLSLGDRP